MRPDRMAQLRQLEESCEDPVDRADLEAQRQAEGWGSYGSPADDVENVEIWRNLEIWQRVLAACTQPLPDAAD